MATGGLVRCWWIVGAVLVMYACCQVAEGGGGCKAVRIQWLIERDVYLDICSQDFGPAPDDNIVSTLKYYLTEADAFLNVIQKMVAVLDANHLQKIDKIQTIRDSNWFYMAKIGVDLFDTFLYDHVSELGLSTAILPFQLSFRYLVSGDTFRASFSLRELTSVSAFLIPVDITVGGEIQLSNEEYRVSIHGQLEVPYTGAQVKIQGAAYYGDNGVGVNGKVAVRLTQDCWFGIAGNVGTNGASGAVAAHCLGLDFSYALNPPPQQRLLIDSDQHQHRQMQHRQIQQGSNSASQGSRSPATCDMKHSERLDCGWPGSVAACRNLGCCYQNIGNNGPHCFHKTGACSSAYSDRQDCGWPGSVEKCLARGCCYEDIGVRGPHCFGKMTIARLV